MPEAANRGFHVLVVDDDVRLRGLLRQYLSTNGYDVDVARDAAEARRRLDAVVYDLVVLDVMMPGEDGLSLARFLRRKSEIPILLLTARKETEHRIEGLESGADDYMGKPFAPREFLLRVEALLRRTGKARGPGWFYFGDYRFDLDTKDLWRGMHKVALTFREGELLRLLATSAPEPVSRHQIGDDDMVQPRSIDVTVNRLRRKIGESGQNPRFLVSVRGEGYALRGEAG